MVFLVAMVEIDLSVGGIIATASSLAALLIKFHHFDPWIAVAIALLAGSILGGSKTAFSPAFSRFHLSSFRLEPCLPISDCT